MKKPEVLHDAVYTFGQTHQIEKAIEEMSELTKELVKYLIGEGDPEHIAEELGDTEITLAQLRIIFDNDEAVDAWKQKKLDRLGGLIFEEKYPGGRV